MKEDASNAAKPSTTAPAVDAKEKTSRLDLLSAAVLSAAALLTTYAGYQAALWDGEQAALYTEASALHVEATRASLHAGQLEGADLMTFGAWLSARASHESELEDFYLRRFRPEFAQAFDAWKATLPKTNAAAPPTPFAMPGYDLKERQQADDLEQRAHDAFAAGQDANEKGDAFVLATVILASALFFGGINQIPHDRRIRKALLAVAIGFCLFGATHIALLPPAP